MRDIFTPKYDCGLWKCVAGRRFGGTSLRLHNSLIKYVISVVKRKKKMEKKEIFADGIGQVHFAGGMVRFDFVTLQPAEDGKAPVPQSNVRIIMPPQGFLGAFNSMQQLIEKLLEAGVLQKNEAPAAAATPKKK